MNDFASSDRQAPRWLRAFRATDTFVVEALRESSRLEGALGAVLAGELRVVSLRCGAALVAASAATSAGAATERLQSVRQGLSAAAYHCNLARRLGMFSLQRYRELMARQQAALREVDAIEGEVWRPPARARPPGVALRVR